MIALRLIHCKFLIEKQARNTKGVQESGPGPLQIFLVVDVFKFKIKLSWNCPPPLFFLDET